MGEQTVISDADPESAAKDMQSDADQDRAPGRLPEGGECAQMDENKENRPHGREILAVRAVDCA